MVEYACDGSSALVNKVRFAVDVEDEATSGTGNWPGAGSENTVKNECMISGLGKWFALRHLMLS